MLKYKIIGTQETSAYANLKNYDHLLVDMHHLIFRAYFAVNLKNQSGEPTQVYHLVLKMLYEIILDLSPKGILLCWDSASSWRKSISATYKANRTRRDPTFFIPFRRLYWLCDKLGFEQVMSTGFEADDWIAYTCAKSKNSLLILSGDRDLFQLINDKKKHHVAYPNKARGCDVIDEARAAEVFYAPADIVSIKAIAGDTSDNIKGVPRVGDKTAYKLVSALGDVNEWLFKDYHNINDLKLVKIIDKVLPYRSDIMIGRRLIDLMHDHSPPGFSLRNISTPDEKYKVFDIDEFCIVNGLEHVRDIKDNLSLRLNNMERVCNLRKDQ